jgi:alkanesulfonate monooxygenase SsuD/methylene tetrahydromethanopterin reductase-like flavin-dependent oxidoreductase (luciferase family)
MDSLPTRALAVGVVPLETRRDVITALAVSAEQLGYSAFSVAEGWGHDSTVLLADIARRTSTIQIGTSVLNVWGRSAATVAMSAITLADLSGGRYVLGLGAGSPALAEGLHDVPFRDPVHRLETQTRQVRRLLEGHRLEPTLTTGNRPLRLAVTPLAPIPIAVAALGPQTIRVAGRLADAWSPFFLPLSDLAPTVDSLDPLSAGHPAREVAGRLQIWPGIACAVADDTAHARSLAAWWITVYLTTMGPLYPRTLRRLGFGVEVDAVIDANPPGSTPRIPAAAQRLIDEVTLCGTPDHARRQLDHWYTGGADLPTLVLPPGADPQDLNFVLEAMAPRRLEEGGGGASASAGASAGAGASASAGASAGATGRVPGPDQ